MIPVLGCLLIEANLAIDMANQMLISMAFVDIEFHTTVAEWF